VIAREEFCAAKWERNPSVLRSGGVEGISPGSEYSAIYAKMHVGDGRLSGRL